MQRRVLIACLALLAFCGWAGTPMRSIAADVQAASMFVEELGKDAITTLGKPNLTRTEARQEFRRLFTTGFDVPWIARFVLARHWRRATAGQKQEFLELFEQLVVETYATQFSDYNGENFRIVEAVERGTLGDVFVTTEIFFEDGPATRVDWVVREQDGEMKIIDVVVEGISMGITQRQEFASVIQRQGGRFDGLLDVLRRKVASVQ